MLFALIDYYQYKSQTGPYDLDSGNDVMCCSFSNYLPKVITDKLEPGDIILQGYFNSYISWFIMYFTKSRISHIALYTGNGKILHTGIGGSVTEPVENIFGENTRILPLKMPIGGSARKKFKNKNFSDYENVDYNLKLVINKGFRIILGRVKRFYSFRLFLDYLIISLVISGLIALLSIKIAIVTLFLFLFITVINIVLSYLKPIKPTDIQSGAPCDIFRVFPNATIIYNPESTFIQNHRNN